MHWAVALLLCLCAASLVLNAAQQRMVGTVRVSGMLVCLFWGAQELHWWLAGSDSIVLFLACDLLLLAWFWRRGAVDWSDRVIAALIPPTAACVIFAWLRGGATPESYWLNISMVAAQMLLGLPRIVRQRASGAYSHGPLRPMESQRGGT
ncbi:hypothetical protein [Novosphingobium sp. ZW T3_23]|uniref:hypothetical protein n=1 Tax=Novosphingobium sp. ZW T3_23 TaxID=3378084 RepID=UPI0038545B2C